MIPYEGISAKRTLSGKSPSAKLLAVSPLVSVSPVDFLGIFPGKLRYTDEKPAGAIQGPIQGLWLERFEVKGKLDRMKVAKAGEQTQHRPTTTIQTGPAGQMASDDAPEPTAGHAPSPPDSIIEADDVSTSDSGHDTDARLSPHCALPIRN
ncbi:hypothetical protein OIDMADRAFT_48720 [Oidiodendron maius Zn]|uniref:Uncharacterized protein n=1 Tax=Oidiodendron maius (strain Zn) TaxID=913774 RepID=A0A0C3I3A8_OIDMZ|nr:hypothetical protein OIDMADRAFT_48720 [Oidiodendron maius Zn]